MAKSVSRKSAAKKAGKKASKKASKTRKSRTTGRKAAKTLKRSSAARKASQTRKTGAAPSAGKAAGTSPQPRIHEVSPAIAEIDTRMAIIRDNLRGLTEQAASSSGASDEELMSQRIAEQEAKLELLKKQREELAKRGS